MPPSRRERAPARRSGGAGAPHPGTAVSTLDKSDTTFYVQSVPAAGTPGARTTPEFRGWLRELRERAGLTQVELAAAVGTDRRNIRRWEVEGHDPSGTMLLRVLAALGVEFAQALPRDVPGPITSELRDVRRDVADGREDAARRHAEVLRRLDAQLDELRTLSARLGATSAQSG